MSHLTVVSYSFFFFFNDTATTEIYTLSLHDALPICRLRRGRRRYARQADAQRLRDRASPRPACPRMARRAREPREPRVLLRSEEHTSELQSRQYLVCRLLLEKKKKINNF